MAESCARRIEAREKLSCERQLRALRTSAESPATYSFPFFSFPFVSFRVPRKRKKPRGDSITRNSGFALNAIIAVIVSIKFLFFHNAHRRAHRHNSSDRVARHMLFLQIRLPRAIFESRELRTCASECIVHVQLNQYTCIYIYLRVYDRYRLQQLHDVTMCWQNALLKRRLRDECFSAFGQKRSMVNYSLSSERASICRGNCLSVFSRSVRKSCAHQCHHCFRNSTNNTVRDKTRAGSGESSGVIPSILFNARELTGGDRIECTDYTSIRRTAYRVRYSICSASECR